MKKLIQMSVASAIVLCASACGNLTGGDERNVEGIGFQETENGAWGILDVKTGKPIYVEEFRNKPSAVVNGFFWVEESPDTSMVKKYALYKVEGKSPKCVAEDLLGMGYYSEGLIPTVTQDSRITLLNEKGDDAFTLEPYNGKEITNCGLRYMSGLLIVKCDGKWGAVNTKGEMVIEPEWQLLDAFLSGRCVAQKKIEGDENTPPEYKWCIIDKKGNIIKEFDCEEESFLNYSKIYDGVWLHRNSDGQQFVDLKTGKVLCKVNKDVDVRRFNSKYYVSEEDGQMRVSNYEGERIVRGYYSDIVLFNDDKFYAQKSSGKGYWLNTEGERIGTLEDCDNLFFNHRANYGLVTVDGSVALLNDKGEIISEEYNSIGSASYHRGNDFTIMSDYFDADAELAKILEPFDFINGSYRDITLGMTAKEVAAKYSDKMNGDYGFWLSDNIIVGFDDFCRTARYVTKTRDGYWGQETYQEQDGYEWTDAKVEQVCVFHAEPLGKDYRLKKIFTKFCEYIEKQGYRCSRTYDEYMKSFMRGNYIIHVRLLSDSESITEKPTLSLAICKMF